MLKLNKNYSDYTDETDAKYPEGKAINASTSESSDGTPLLADFMNDINAAHIAMYELAYGTRDGITGKADTQKASQFVDAVAKLVFDKIKAHADLRGLADGVHGATSEAIGGQIASRDGFGNISVGSAINDADAINLGDVNQKFEDADLKEASHRDVDDDLSDAESENLPTTKAVNDALTNRKQILIRDYIFSNQYDATVFNIKYSTLKLPNVKPEGMFVVSNSTPHGLFCGGCDFTDTQFTFGYRYFYSVPFSVILKLAFIYDADAKLS